MDKIVTITISGVVFNLEENAYTLLSTYLNQINRCFLNSEGGKEIIADIESRIAELFLYKIKGVKQAITETDVNEIIATMGNPESFDSFETSNSQPSSFDFNTKSTTSSLITKKRIFRDPDNKVLGGVCSGISHYFGIDPLWLRLAFAVAFFGFGIGIWLYLILLFIIPIAKTAADKLEMKGEPVTIATIEKNIREELNDLKKRRDNLWNEAKQVNTDNKLILFARQLINLLANLIKLFGKFIVKILGGIALFIGILLLIISSALFFGSDNVVQLIEVNGVESFSFNELMSVIFNSPNQQIIAKIGLALIIISIIIWLLFSGVRIFFKIRHNRRIVNGAAISMWLLGMLICIWIGISISNQFSSVNRVRTHVTLNPLNAKVIYLMMNEGDSLYNSKTLVNKSNNSLISITDSLLILGYPKIEIIKSHNDSFQIEIVRTGRGYNKKEALIRANNLTYQYQTTDSSIIFNKYFTAPVNDKFRAQELKIILKVPVGKVIYLAPNLEGYIYDIDNTSNTFDDDMIARRWEMKNDGLSCIDCDGINTNTFTKSKRIIIKEKNGKKVIIKEEVQLEEDDSKNENE